MSGPAASRRRSVAVGIVVSMGYVLAVVGASWAGLGSGAPLLDGFGPPVAYRWVRPPPSLASGNKPPKSEQPFTVKLDAQGSEADVLTTSDLQALLVLGLRSIPPKPGATSVDVEVSALAASDLGPPPPGLIVWGNVYRYTATYVPSGDPIMDLASPGNLTLVYPSFASATHVVHRLIFSADGKRWQELPIADNAAGQMASARISSLGYYAVSIPANAAEGEGQSPSPSGGAVRGGGGGFLVIVAVAVAGVLVVVAIVVIARRRAAARAAAERPTRSSAAQRGSGGAGAPRRKPRRRGRH